MLKFGMKNGHDIPEYILKNQGSWSSVNLKSEVRIFFSFIFSVNNKSNLKLVYQVVSQIKIQQLMQVK